MSDRPLRVVHVTATAQRRGAEMFAADLIGELASAGIEQRLVALRNHDGLIVPVDVSISVLRARTWRPLRIDPGALVRLRRLTVAWGADVVQAHGGEALKYALPATARTGAAVVYRRIGSTQSGSAGALRLAGHKRLARRAAAVVALSEASRRELAHSFGVPVGLIELIPNAVSPERLRFTVSRAESRRGLGVDADAEVVVSVAALHPEKDPIGTLEVFERVAGRRPRAVLMMVGEGPLDEATRSAVTVKGLERRVRMLGARDDVADVMRAADVLLLASRSEGMPAVVIEAGMAGLPVAAYALGGVPEVVADGVTGLLAPPGDWAALAERVVALLSDEQRRESMGRSGRDLCLAEFSVAAIAPRYAHLYHSLSVRTDRPRTADSTQ